MVPNLTENPFRPVINNRTGRKCAVNAFPRQSKIAAVRSASLTVHGCRLFNCLPKTIRDKSACSLQSFKELLDSFLKQIPDEPQLNGYTKYRRADSNSVIDMILIDGRRLELKAGHLDV